jgi:hypothetical protein
MLVNLAEPISAITCRGPGTFLEWMPSGLYIHDLRGFDASAALDGKRRALELRRVE